MGRGAGESEAIGREEAAFKARILLVEDDHSVASSLIRLLNMQGHIVDLASNLATATDAWERREEVGGYHLIISDYELPDGFGTGFLNEVIANGTGRAKTFLWSGVDRYGEVEKQMPIAPDYVTTKGINGSKTLHSVIASLAPTAGTAPP